MPSSTPIPLKNRLLAGLSLQDRQAVPGGSQAVNLRFGQVLCEAGAPYTHVYFPVTAFISLVTSVRGHPPLEIGLIGYEGVLGATLLLGARAAPWRAIVQGAGTALRLDVRHFGRAVRRSRGLLRRLNFYLYSSMAQVAQSAICNQFHSVESRLARWLLMSHDRARARHFRVTHEFLAGMLGVRRSGVTTAAGDLQRRGLIRYSRGEIAVLDRPGLERASCECYQAGIDIHASVLG